MIFNTFQRNVLFVLTATLIFGGLVFSGLSIKNSVIEYREQVRVADQKHRVERIMRLNCCAKFNESEHSRLDKVLLNAIETKRILIEIHSERKGTWMSNFRNAMRDVDRYKNLHISAPAGISYMVEYNNAVEYAKLSANEYVAFSEAVDKLEKHDVSAPFVLDKKPTTKAIDRVEQEHTGRI